MLTFNYTRTLELIAGSGDSTVGRLSENEEDVVFGEIEHFHGKLGETLILGVNDESQIANETLRGSEEAMEVCVKPVHVRELGHMSDTRCTRIINNANLIYIFGSSIGWTDKIWWERIGARLREDCLLIIFVRSQDVSPIRMVTTNRIKRRVVKDFLEKTTLSEKEKESAKKKIYVCVNQDIFHLTE